MTIDQDGVGELVRIGADRGRRTRPDIKMGICGEHGGDPKSIDFCERVGLTYVSCSPYRVPIARLAAAQARAGQPHRHAAGAAERREGVARGFRTAARDHRQPALTQDHRRKAAAMYDPWPKNEG